jgi:uncharacterized protein (DUF362 family)/Pyruvate/2-oxoacid:ferredoxin oxidoreductase delta subunit
MSTVFIRQAAYDAQIIRPLIFEMLTSAQAPVIGAGTRVLIKPNFLAPAPPGRAVTTHPLLVRAAAEFALDRGARVQISDSPAMGSFARLLRVGGYTEVLAGLDVIAKPFAATTPVDVGDPFGVIDIAADAMQADVVLNLAKLKTHTQMMLTLGVKNLFGCVVGLKKAEWHLRAGVDRQMFARLIVGICEAVNPAYTIVDGILGMHGQGPGKSGTPREMGLLIGGASAHAVDHSICLLLGVAPQRLQTLACAREMGRFDGSVRINGNVQVQHGFQIPELGPVTTGPAYLDRFMRRFVIQRPVIAERACKRCGECWTICPATAIDQTEQGIRFDTERCIRCYCCLEVCPHAAIQAQTPVAGRLIDWLQKKRLRRS